MMTDILHITEPTSHWFDLKWLQIVAKEGTVTAMHLCIILCVCVDMSRVFVYMYIQHRKYWPWSRMVIQPTGGHWE